MHENAEFLSLNLLFRGLRVGGAHAPEGPLRVEVRKQHLHLPGLLPEDGHRQEGVHEVLRVVEEVREGVPLDHLFIFRKHNNEGLFYLVRLADRCSHQTAEATTANYDGDTGNLYTHASSGHDFQPYEVQ